MNLKKRLNTLEITQKSAPLTKAQEARQLDELLAKHGLTRETATATYGSVGAFCYALMVQPDAHPRPQPADGLTAQERYLQMILQKG